MSLRIVRPTCCGVDIHKDIIVVTIRKPKKPNTQSKIHYPF